MSLLDLLLLLLLVSAATESPATSLFFFCSNGSPISSLALFFCGQWISCIFSCGYFLISLNILPFLILWPMNSLHIFMLQLSVATKSLVYSPVTTNECWLISSFVFSSFFCTHWISCHCVSCNFLWPMDFPVSSPAVTFWSQCISCFFYCWYLLWLPDLLLLLLLLLSAVTKFPASSTALTFCGQWMQWGERDCSTNPVIWLHSYITVHCKGSARDRVDMAQTVQICAAH